jgi:hypothetical protein
MRGNVPTGLVVGAVAATALVSAGPAALLPFKDMVVGAVDVSVALVVDFGTAGVVTGCVKVPAGDDGYDALAAFTQQENEALPTYNSSGLLCSINNVPNQSPSPVCGQQGPGGYDYWSYWHGSTGTWVYADTGASGTVTDGDVEGWRFEDPGTGKPNDPAPRAAPDYAAICGPTTPTTSPVTTSPVATSSPVSSGTPSSVASSSGEQPSAGGSAPETPTGATRASAGSDGRTTPPLASSVPTARRHGEAAGASPSKTHGGGGNHATPLVVTGAILATLAGVATFRRRRRPRMP